jgi:DNA processing protein
MSAPSHATDAGGACAACLRRSWLLSTLSGPLDCCARDRDRLQALLALEDLQLLEAVGGSRRAQLRAQYDAFDPQSLHVGAGVESLCRHHPVYPEALAGAAAPHMLNVLGGARRLAALRSTPVVAIVGSRVPSDYGREMARSLARGLAVSGVSVVGGWQDGIAMAAHVGALEAAGAGVAVAVMGGGLEASSTRRRRALLGQLARVGCAVSELPCDCGGRRWGTLASERTVAALAAVTVVVEAEQTAGDLAVARLAQARGGTVAAIPGRVTSPLSHGTNALLKSGATVVRDPGDVLELLYSTEVWRAPSAPEQSVQALSVEPGLQTLLERVGAGVDTPERLVRAGASSGETLQGLSELELMGLLRRGDGGRYVPTRALQATFQPSKPNGPS